MKLSEEKFVKVLNKGDTFMAAEAERFTSKNLTHLFITKGDGATFLKFFTDQLDLLESNDKLDPETKTKMSLESIEIVERLSKTLGWTPEIVTTAKKSINLAISAVSSHPNILKLLKHRLNNHETPYMQHAGPLAMVSCVFCQQLGWTSDSAQLKLAMAALMHDMSLEDSYFKHIKTWNQSAKNDKERSIEVERYRNHPTDAALMVQSIKNLPPDIDQIIHQHHEAPDGAGFPRSLIHSRISPMSALFIIAEDMLEYIGEEENLGPLVMDFVREREMVYNEGNFKRVFQVLKHHLLVNK